MNPVQVHLFLAFIAALLTVLVILTGWDTGVGDVAQKVHAKGRNEDIVLALAIAPSLFFLITFLGFTFLAYIYKGPCSPLMNVIYRWFGVPVPDSKMYDYAIGDDERTKWNKKGLLRSVSIGVIAALVFFLTDKFVFKKRSLILTARFLRPDFSLARLTWRIVMDAILVELLFRVFAMSTYYAIFEWYELGHIVVWWNANILISVAYGVFLIPTKSTYLTRTPWDFARGWIMNSIVSLFYGEQFRRYGFEYAMLAHAIMIICYEGILIPVFSSKI